MLYVVRSIMQVSLYGTTFYELFYVVKEFPAYKGKVQYVCNEYCLAQHAYIQYIEVTIWVYGFCCC